MKRFWNAVTVGQVAADWQVALDDKPVKTQGGKPQVVPSRPLAEAMAAEWRAQGEMVDPAGFPMRDMADFAIDQVTPDRQGTVAKLLQFAETDTLCYRAGPDEPLWKRQMDTWEPMLTATEEREGVRFERVTGVGFKAQPETTQTILAERLAQRDPFTLTALQTMASLAASLCVALAAEARSADAATLFSAANLEEDWQAEQWGWDADAERVRTGREAQFARAMEFLELVNAA